MTADRGPGSPISRPKVSLIVATCNRVQELERLLGSLEQQTYRTFEVVVVDQNPDDRLVPVLQRHSTLEIHHLRCELGASRARNAGLRIAEGEIIAFPDDDCWYSRELVASVCEWFQGQPDFDGLVVGLRNPEGKLMTPKFPPPQGPLTKRSVLRCAMAVNVFLRRRAVKTVGFFREDMGPGTPSRFQSGEDLDFILRPLERGLRVWYQPALTVYHPELNSKPRLSQVTYGYSLGVGHIWQTHRLPWWWCLGEILFRSVGGAAFHLCKGDVDTSYIYLRRAAGQLRGYTLRSKEQAARRDVHPIADDHA